VAQTTLAGTTVAEVMAELAAIEDPKSREVNARHGDDHGVNLSKPARVRQAAKDPAGSCTRTVPTGDTAPDCWRF